MQIDQKLWQAFTERITHISDRATCCARRYSKTKRKSETHASPSALTMRATGKELSMDYRKIIKEIGRGKNHARDLDKDTARGLYTHMMNG